MLKAGTALTDISPEKGLPLAGYPRHPRNNTGVHDPLYASCLFLDDGKSQIEIICMDVAGYSKESVRAVREGIAKGTGIPAGNIMICCSHTHSGPWTSSWLDLDDYEHPLGPDPEYAAFLQKTLIALGIEAARAPFAALIGIEKTFCGKEKGIGGNRRNPNEAADPEVWVIGVKDSSEVLRACLTKYALHPTFIHSDSFLVSADYPGYMRKHLGEKYPEMMFMFAQGTSGNQSPRFFRSGKTFEEAERAGRTLGNAVLEVLSSMEFREDAALGVFSEHVKVDTRQLPAFADAEAASKKYRALWDEAKRSSSSERDVWIAELKSLGADCVRAYAGIKEKGRLGEFLDDIPCEVQVLKIGDARVVGLPGELFVEFGLTIQYRAPFEKCFVVTLANGGLPGYVCTAKAYAEGGYESGTSMLTDTSGDQLVEAAVRLLKKSV